jgi:hypothetical protein
MRPCNAHELHAWDVGKVLQSKEAKAAAANYSNPEWTLLGAHHWFRRRTGSSSGGR